MTAENKKDLKTMVAVDMRRMFTSRLLYIMLAVCLVTPILILTMTSGFGGEDLPMLQNVWQIIGSGGNEGMAMDMTTMCNINLLYFGIAVFVALFVSDDFRSGYAKNLFAVRAKKGSYVVSKTIVCFIAAALMLFAFFAGAMLGGTFGGLSFALGSVSIFNIVMCMLAKLFLMLVFVGI